MPGHDVMMGRMRGQATNYPAAHGGLWRSAHPPCMPAHHRPALPARLVAAAARARPALESANPAERTEEPFGPT